MKNVAPLPAFRVLVQALAVVSACWIVCPASAYGEDAAPSENAAPSGADAALDPIDVELLTKDRVQLAFRFFPGSRGKQTIPIIMLHGWEGPYGAGAGKDLYQLAQRLQQAGHAVGVPDLRGHGGSQFYETDNETTAPIDRNRFRATDFRDMMLDVEAVRSYLVQRNNAGELNLELLCVIGFEMGSVVALNWIHYDWMVPSFPTLKQGQDAKAFVLISPEQTFRGFAIRPAMANQALRSDLSAMIAYGKLDSRSAEGKRLYNTLRRSRRVTQRANSDAAKQQQDLFLVELNTRLRGSKLVSAPGLGLANHVLEFIERRLVSQRENLIWRDRSIN